MNFFIKKDSTFPILVYPITEKLMKQLNLTESMFENVAVTFSMTNSTTNAYKIANSGGFLYINNVEENPDMEKFSIGFKFNLNQTHVSGNYFGEFVIDFLDNDNMGKLKLPLDDKINIVINETITKTTVV